MAKKSFLALLFLGFGLAMLHAQSDDRTLFTVDGEPVRVDEFTYIYSKTNGDRADFSRPSLEEYLDLYIKFRLKVHKAKELQLDTIPTLKKELDGYRRQLADSYLVNKRVTNRLLREAYERKKQDVALRHILFKLDPNASAEEESAAYEKALAAYELIRSGKQSFESMAKTASEDEGTKEQGGYIGFQTALFPPGFYPLETAAYTLPVGQVSEPIRTRAGFHLVQVDERRPARGEVEVAHILIRRQEESPEIAGRRIDSIYTALENGADFDLLARSLSQDKRTASNGGYLGHFGINTYQSSFEEAAFGIAEDGRYAKPVETKVGWHIIKRISRRGIQPFEVMESRLETKVRRDPRFEQAVDTMVQDIIREAGLTEYPEVLNQFKASLNDTFLTFRWKAPEEPSKARLFEMGDTPYTLGDFERYLAKTTRERIRKKGRMEPAEAAELFYKDFLKEEAMRYEETQLESKYPEFRGLMREYSEGILLFEATKMLVWDKAAQDSTGLEAFYRSNRGRYRWDERALVTEYRLARDAADQMDKLRAFAADHQPEEVLKAFNGPDKAIVVMDQRTIEKDKGVMPRNLPWEAGAMTPAEQAPRSKDQRFFKVEKLMEPGFKSLDEARGYVIADYQDYLEAQWVEGLREEYPVKVNQTVFDSLIKKEK